MQGKSDIEAPLLADEGMPVSGNNGFSPKYEGETAPRYEEKISPCRLFQRILIAFIGVSLGAITMLPNAMMASYSLNGARIGMLASATFAFGGIIGAIRLSWSSLFIGLFLQVLALLWGEMGLDNHNKP